MVTVNIKGKEYSLKEAREIYDELSLLFKEDSIAVKPTYTPDTFKPVIMPLSDPSTPPYKITC